MGLFWVWLSVYFLLASAFYIIDKDGKFGLRSLYNLGRRQEDIDAEPNKGFVYNQTSMKKWVFAGFFDIVLSSILWYFNAMETGVKILLGFSGFIAIFFGFWFGGILVEKLSRGAKRSVEIIDDIETGKINPKKIVSDVAEDLSDKANGAFNDLSEKASDAVHEIADVAKDTVSQAVNSNPAKAEKNKQQDSVVKPEDTQDVDEEKALEALKKFQK